MPKTIMLNQLWKTDRHQAVSLFKQAYAFFEAKYGDDLTGDWASLCKRMNRQNHMPGFTTGAGTEIPGFQDNPTSVWTAIGVTVDNAGMVTEARLTELYPHGIMMPTHDFSLTGAVSTALKDALLKEVKDPANKTNILGADTAYDGKTWREVAEKYQGAVLEIDASLPAPEGYVRVPINHIQPPLGEGLDFVPLAFYYQRASGTTGPLNVDDYACIAKHLKGYSEVLFGEYVDDLEANDPIAVKARANLVAELDEVAKLASNLVRSSIQPSRKAQQLKP